jgi:hypothetical protein
VLGGPKVRDVQPQACVVVLSEEDLVQDLASERPGFSCESPAFSIGEANAPPTQALLEHAVFFLEILDHVRLMAVDPQPANIRSSS